MGVVYLLNVCSSAPEGQPTQKKAGSFAQNDQKEWQSASLETVLVTVLLDMIKYPPRIRLKGKITLLYVQRDIVHHS